ncbi:MAG: hypothetical protein ABL949_08290 [Fimbriimonadaceae bacterium]
MLIATLLAFTMGQATLNLPELKDFDQRSVGSITFGQTADKDLKKLFKVGKGAMRPEALVVSNDDDWRADALLDGRGANAKAIGVWFESKSSALLYDLVKELGEPQKLFLAGRSSDWMVVAYPERGVAVVTAHEAEKDFVLGVLLTNKQRILSLSRDLTQAVTPLVDLQGLFDRLDRTVYIRPFDVTVSCKNINIGNADREASLLTSLAIRRFETRNLLLQRGAAGTMSVSVTIDFEKVNVSASLSGKNEAGSISGSGGASTKFSVSNDVAHYRRDFVEDAVLEAMFDAVQSAEQAIRNQRPQTQKDHRRLQVYQVISSAVR